ncbi:hypothetical protein [Bailinhaonella thermotolerans]|uniref:Uncharacterized protein n=1 Tax=Bailinhaonella thermotolerans TaxID=1070861 RepID=A0A3A4BGT2_9ACTN|nr:hypothetical protein [Bailinhaonella thermotolerans]RJL30502.1 hypothetical protein D5H75_23385 [Bailinhaonella thermotolerans]
MSVKPDPELVRLRRALRERDGRIQELAARLAAVEGSVTLRVGQTLVGAARRPGRRMVRLPRDLYRLWRTSARTDVRETSERPAPAPSQTEAPGTVPSPFLGLTEEERLLVAPRDRLVIAGVLTPEAVAALEPYAHVVPLTPHAAELVGDLRDPDLVLIQAAACTGHGPWAHLGDPAATDRERRIREVIASSQIRGRPVVLWRDAPAAPGLRRLPVDEVVEGDLGVPLHLYNPIALDPARSRVPLVHTAGPRPPEVPGPVAHAVRHEPARFREHAVAVVDTEAAALRALACGARVVSTVPVPGAAHAPDAASLAAETAAAVGAGPRTEEEQREVTRRLFAEHALPVRLAALLSRLGLDAGPLASRRVSVLVTPAAGDPRTLAAELRAQTLAPAEIVLPAELGATASELPGVPVRLAPGGGWEGLVAAAREPYVVRWTPGRGPHALADLLCALECSGADAIGIRPPEAAGNGGTANGALAGEGLAAAGIRAAGLGDAGARGGTRGPAAGWAFGAEAGLEPVLMRRDLAAVLDPAAWARGGARLLAIPGG